MHHNRSSTFAADFLIQGATPLQRPQEPPPAGGNVLHPHQQKNPHFALSRYPELQVFSTSQQLPQLGRNGQKKHNQERGAGGRHSDTTVQPPEAKGAELL